MKGKIFMCEVKGLTGKVSEIKEAVPADSSVRAFSSDMTAEDIDLKRMAQWAMNYLIRTPRKEFDYEPVFQCNPMRIPPIPEGHDVVVPCDTDARLDWEWYYMREISGSQAGKDVEAEYHRRIRNYVEEDGFVIAHPGSLNEGDINHIYGKDEYGYHIWGATKIMNSMAEDYKRTGNEQSKATAKKIMKKLKSVATYLSEDVCYFVSGMGMMRRDGTPMPNGWNAIPAPIVEPLVNCFLTFQDEEYLEFAKAYANGIMSGAQPDGIKIKANGDITNGHSHTTMHAIWGIGHLGIVTNIKKYTEFAKKTFDFMLGQGTGAGWFPAMPYGHTTDETCLTSDMMSNATMIARGGYPEYFDYVERYLRNRISPCQFIITPEFEAEYRKMHSDIGEEEIRKWLREDEKYQGAVRSFCGLNDIENALLKGSYHMLAGCCVPEGMRSIYTTWSNVIDKYPETVLGPAGVYVNMSFNRESEWGRVFSYIPNKGQLGVKASVDDTFFIRPPHWAPRDKVRAFSNTKQIPVKWSGDYVRFDSVKAGDEVCVTYPIMSFKHEAGGVWKQYIPDVKLTYEWFGNTVAAVDPPAEKTPAFSKKPRVLPKPPEFILNDKG